MEYTIRSGDGREYGPATLEHLTGWIREGRVNPQTEIRRSDMQHWAPAASFVELQGVLSPSPIPATPHTISPNPARATGDPQLFARMKSGASWFYWIAGLSLINSVSAAAGQGIHFLFGLGITQLLDYLGAQSGGAAKAVTLGLSVGVAGIFILFGVFAHKRHLWAFIGGIVLFAIDTLLILFFRQWLSLAFHVFALFCLFLGLQACRALKAAR